MKKCLCIILGCLALAACGDGRDPGFVCVTNCDHSCADGISGDSCRADQQHQADEQTRHDQQQQKDDNYAY